MASMNSSSLSRSESVSRRGFLFRLVKSISMLAIVSVVVVLTCSQVSCAPADHPTEAVPRGLSVLGDVFTAGVAVQQRAGMERERAIGDTASVMQHAAGGGGGPAGGESACGGVRCR